MANDPKTGKKAATKAAKVAGTHKVPRYAKNESDTAPDPIKIVSKKGK